MHINTNTGFLFSGCLNITHKGSLKTLQNLFSGCLIHPIQTNVSKSSQNA